MIFLDDLAQVQAKPLEGGIAARLGLQFLKADMPFGPLAAMFAGDLVYKAARFKASNIAFRVRPRRSAAHACFK